MAGYLVLGRTAYAAPLAVVGTVEAADTEAAAEATLARHGSDWVELAVAERDEVSWVITAEQEAR